MVEQPTADCAAAVLASSPTPTHHPLQGWGNNEKQWYTDLPQNLRVDSGNLVLSAVWDPSAAAIRDQPLTSARIRTFGKHSFGPSPTHPLVKIEARIKLPSGLGLWPAFWMLPADDATASCSGCGRHGVWAASGEIDIMEVANDATQVCNCCQRCVVAFVSVPLLRCLLFCVVLRCRHPSYKLGNLVLGRGGGDGGGRGVLMPSACLTQSAH